MTTASQVSDFDPRAFIVDDPAKSTFRVDRGVYLDEALFEQEMRQIFEGSWIYLCHESEIPVAGDYVTAWMGRQPVVINRRKDGSIGGFVNACSHRGTVLAPLRRGTAKTFTCRFHGWSYNDTGRCIKIKNESAGAYPVDEDCLAKAHLKVIPRVESYKGFVFGSLCADVGSLKSSLGAAAVWVDLLADQSPQGLEVLPGESTYIIRGNWKMGGENGVDGYHVSTVHRVFAAAMAKREEVGNLSGVAKTEAGRINGTVPTGGVDLGNGHLAIWAKRENPEAAPLFEAKERLLQTYSPVKVSWMVDVGRNLYLFPNVLLMDQPSTQIRTIRPLSPGRAELKVQCIAPRGESQTARQARMRKFLDFYLPTGMATSDDIAALEDTFIGGHGRLSRWNDYSRGMAGVIPGSQYEPLQAIDCNAVSVSPSWDHETLYHGYYRRWLQLMAGNEQ
jgi:benzoate/toluate 1,2-dioxygenase alpha subunit